MLPDKIGYIVDQLSSFDENIPFTFEIKEENKPALLEVMVVTNTNDTINATFYRKPTNTNIYINWHSHLSLQWKKTTAKVLTQRTIKICFNEKFLDEELDIIEHNLCEVNGYSRKFVRNISNHNLHKRNSISPNLNKRKNSKEIQSYIY